MSRYMSTDAVSAIIGSSGAVSADPLLRGSSLGQNLISGSPCPDFAQPESGPRESLGAFRGIAWSLVFEGAGAAMIYAIWQVWKIVR